MWEFDDRVNLIWSHLAAVVGLDTVWTLHHLGHHCDKSFGWRSTGYQPAGNDPCLFKLHCGFLISSFDNETTHVYELLAAFHHGKAGSKVVSHSYSFVEVEMTID